MTSYKEIITSLRVCSEHKSCDECCIGDPEEFCCSHQLMGIAADCIEQIMGTVEQKNDVSQETPVLSEPQLCIFPKSQAEIMYEATVTIPISEYQFLTCANAWLDIILRCRKWSREDVIASVREALADMGCRIPEIAEEDT